MIDKKRHEHIGFTEHCFSLFDLRILNKVSQKITQFKQDQSQIPTNEIK